MDTVILAGGYAKRMVPTTNELPKQLLPVDGRPVLSYILDSLEKFYTLQGGKCYLSVNSKYKRDFNNFIKNSKINFPLELIVENNSSEEKKLGSVGALYNIFRQGIVSTKPGVMVIGGDNIFSLDLEKFYNEFISNAKEYLGYNFTSENEITPPSLFVIYEKGLEKAKLYGSVELRDPISELCTELNIKSKTMPSTIKECIKDRSLYPITKLILYKLKNSEPKEKDKSQGINAFREKTENPKSP